MGTTNLIKGLLGYWNKVLANRTPDHHEQEPGFLTVLHANVTSVGSSLGKAVHGARMAFPRV